MDEINNKEPLEKDLIPNQFNLQDITNNIKTARLLSPMYSSNIGELNLVLQYTYQSLQFFNKGQYEISKKLKEISIKNMQNFELLGKILYKLGVNPIFTFYPPLPINYYSARYVNYNNNPKKMLNISLQAENRAVANYTRILKQINNKTIEDVLKLFIKGKEEVIKVLNEIILSIK